MSKFIREIFNKWLSGAIWQEDSVMSQLGIFQPRGVYHLVSHRERTNWWVEGHNTWNDQSLKQWPGERDKDGASVSWGIRPLCRDDMWNETWVLRRASPSKIWGGTVEAVEGGEARAKALRQEQTQHLRGTERSCEEGDSDWGQGDKDKTGRDLGGDKTRRTGIWREAGIPSKGNGSPSTDEWINVGSIHLRE